MLKLRKRQLLRLVVFIFIIASLSSCSNLFAKDEEIYINFELQFSENQRSELQLNFREELILSEQLQFDPELSDVELIIENDEIPWNLHYLTLTLVNNSSTNIIFGDDFRIEFREEDRWFDLRSEPAVFNMIAYPLERRSSETFIRDLSILPSGFALAGRYRIIKNVSPESCDIAGSQTCSHDVYTEFVIE